MQNTVFRVIALIIILGIFYSCNQNDAPDPTPDPDIPEVSIYQECVPDLDEATFDIVTWNIENFPATDYQVEQVVEIITTLDADLIALQEIESQAVFDELLTLLPGWAGEISITGSLNLAFLYKTEEVTLGTISELFLGMNQPFPRAPTLTTATHVNGISLTLINNHLKCCGGTANVNRRKEASNLLKEYVDSNLPDDKVIILGDLNDIIYSETGEPITFQNFLDDPDDYAFADMEIALTEPNWSYPSWPSHIDHLLITNELFNEVDTTQTLLLDDCESGYINSISDHRPVLIRLSK